MHGITARQRLYLTIHTNQHSRVIVVPRLFRSAICKARPIRDLS